MYRILVPEPEYFDAEAISILRKVGKVTAKRMSETEFAREVVDADVVAIRVDVRITRALIDRAKRLRIIASASTGLDHIDTEYAKKKGIEIISLHGIHTDSTAEHTIALMLSLAHRVPWAFDSLRSGEWERWRFIGTLLKGKTLGVLGAGRIGSEVAAYSRSMGMNVMAHDPYVKKLPGARMVSLERLLKESDIVTVHVALTDETRFMLARRQLRMMKRSALLVNTARGDVLKTEDLLDALRNGTIAGAALDVFPNEPYIARSNPIIAYARKSNNLLITPHLGASTVETVHKAGVEIAKEIKARLKE